jgi:hypothetical protein
MKSSSGVVQRTKYPGGDGERRANLPQRVCACGPGTHHAGWYVCSPERENGGRGVWLCGVTEMCC